MSASASLGVLLDHVQDKVVLLDGSGRITYANDAVRRILGWEPAELVGENAFEHVHPEDVEDARSAFERTIASETFAETTVEYRFRTADGSWEWLESRMSNLTDGQLDGYVVSSRDVSDRLEAQRERRETARRLEEIAASAGDVLWMFDGDWSELLFVNPAYEELYGRPVEELESDPRTFLEVIHPEDVPAVEDAMECLSAGNPVDLEYRVNPGRDYALWVWVQAEPIVEDGEVVRIAGFSRDVTDRRRRERQLSVMDNLLRHNLRNDLGTIWGNAELIEEAAPELSDRTAVIRRTSERLLESAEKQRDIIDLLTGDPTPGRVDMVDVVGGSVGTVRERFPDASLEVSTPWEAPAHAVDEMHLAVTELIENAIDHSASGAPSVSVSLRLADGEVVLEVADDAPPMPGMEANVLTGEHEMDGVYHSSGLGLWLIYWVVELSEGSVRVDAGDGGNRIEVRLARREP